MLLHLVWITVVYGLALGVVHLMYVLSKRTEQEVRVNKQLRYLLFTSNYEHQMEWIIRALWLYALLRGKEIRVIVVDDDSTDHTLAILQRLSELSGIDLVIAPIERSQDEEIAHYLSTTFAGDTIVVDLRIPLEAGHIPYVQN